MCHFGVSVQCSYTQLTHNPPRSKDIKRSKLPAYPIYDKSFILQASCEKITAATVNNKKIKR